MIQHIEIHQFCGSRRASIWLNGFYITKVFQLLPYPPDQHTRVQNRIFFKQQQNLNILKVICFPMFVCHFLGQAHLEQSIDLSHFWILE